MFPGKRKQIGDNEKGVSKYSLKYYEVLLYQYLRWPKIKTVSNFTQDSSPRINEYNLLSPLHLKHWLHWHSHQRSDTIFNHCSVQFSCSVTSNSLRPHGLQHARPPCPSLTTGVYPNSSPKSGDAIQPSHLLSSPSPPTFSLSQHQGLFQWVNSLHQVAKGLEFQLQHQSFQWAPRTHLFRIDWLDLLAVQGTLKSLLQFDSSKASILQRSAFNSHIHTRLLNKP